VSRFRLATWCVFLLLGLGAGCALAADPPAPAPVYVKAGHLFDATADSLRENVVLVIEGERITRVAPAAEVQVPAGAKRCNAQAVGKPCRHAEDIDAHRAG